MNSKCSHQPEQIKYLCCNETCFEYLCGNCSESHKFNHVRPFDQSKVKPVTEVRQSCSEKVNEAIDSFRYELDKLEKYQEEMTDVSQLEEGLKIIQVAKEDLVRQVKKYFKQMQERFSEEMEALRSDAEENFTNLHSKMSLAMQNLGNLLKNLNDSKNPANMQKSILKAMNVDLAYEIKRYNSSLVHLTDKLYSFNLNRAILDDIVGKLPTYLSIQVKNKKVDLLDTSMALEKSFDRMPDNSIAKIVSKSIGNSSAMSNNSTLKPDSSFMKIPIQNSPRGNLIQNSPRGNFKDFEISTNEYFSCSKETQFLHYFEGNSKNLYLLPINEVAEKSGKATFHKVELKNIFDIPLRHRSLVTPDGDIFISGGVEGPQELRNLYVVNYVKVSLEARSMMIVPRKSHGFCYQSGHLYAIGGFNKHDGFLTKCEKYDIAKDQWTVIADLNVPASSPGVCAFRDRFVYKFGGLSKESTLNNTIEKYNMAENTWTSYEVSDMEESKVTSFRLMWLLSCCQINQGQIYVFGGCDRDDKPVKGGFLFEFSDNSSGGFKIKKVNAVEMPSAGGFWNTQAVIQGGKMYALQNVVKDSKEAFEDKRNLLVFDSSKWTMLKGS